MSDGGFIIAGIARRFVGATRNLDGRITRTDSQGNILWTFQTMRPRWDEWHGMTATDDGYVFSGGHVVRGSMRTHLMKIDFDGRVLWDRIYLDFGYSWHVAEDGRGGFVAAGAVTSGPQMKPKLQARATVTFVLNVDRDGNQTDGQYVGGAFNDEARYVLPTADGKLLVAGYYGVEEGVKPTSNTETAWDRDLLIYELNWRELLRAGRKRRIGL
jgi:hypothetical protein